MVRMTEWIRRFSLYHITPMDLDGLKLATDGDNTVDL
jgi:hypothetical protein